METLTVALPSTNIYGHFKLKYDLGHICASMNNYVKKNSNFSQCIYCRYMELIRGDCDSILIDTQTCYKMEKARNKNKLDLREI